MVLRPEVVERLLLCKALLAKIRFTPVARPDRASLAGQIIAAHDAAELAIAAICHQTGASPPKDQHYLMSYFQPLADACHKGKDVFAKDYFGQLNRVRVDIKHLGIFPDPQQWSRVGETVFGHVSKWCQDYLGIPLTAIDQSSLLIHEDVKIVYAVAKNAAENGDYKECLEYLAKAFYELFHRNAALRGLTVGRASPEDTIRLTGFGVPANDYLALQEFLPEVNEGADKMLHANWRQSQYGHPGNWTQDAAEFCLNIFLDVALKIQHAEWIPGALERDILYDQQIEALKDGVEIWMEVKKDSKGKMLVGLEALVPGELHRELVRVLKRGECIRARVSIATQSSGDPMKDAFLGGGVKNRSVLELFGYDFDAESMFHGKVLASEVRVTCVPRDSEFIRERFSWLPTFDWEPE